jgi:hypothetical protein
MPRLHQTGSSTWSASRSFTSHPHVLVPALACLSKVLRRAEAGAGGAWSTQRGRTGRPLPWAVLYCVAAVGGGAVGTLGTPKLTTRRQMAWNPHQCPVVVTARRQAQQESASSTGRHPDTARRPLSAEPPMAQAASASPAVSRGGRHLARPPEPVRRGRAHRPPRQRFRHSPGLAHRPTPPTTGRRGRA